MARTFALLAAIAAACSSAHARVGDGWGTNIHWTSSSTPGEPEMLARAFKVARMDFTWGGIEKVGSCGTYNFSAYDTLLGIMKSNGVRPYWILDYGNGCYPPTGSYGQACNTAACIAAYGRFAAAAAAHFRGNGIIWETVNEPNGMGHDNATDLAALALAAGGAFSSAGETFVGPATAGMDFGYMNSTFAAGALRAYSAVSVHPYRSGPPESVVADWAVVRGLIQQWAPPGKQGMEMISGEWGYTSALPPCPYGNRVDELGQGKYAARMWLNNLLANVTVDVSYDWKDDGENATDCESNFGSVRIPSTGNASQPFNPKPFYLAALTAQTGVGDAQAFGGRVTPASIGPAQPNGATQPAAAEVYVLGFTGYPGNTAGVAFAAWTNATQCVTPQPTGRSDCGFYGITQAQCSQRRCCWDPTGPTDKPQCYTGAPLTAPLQVSFPVASAATPGTPANSCFRAVDLLGNSQGSVCAANGLVTVGITDGPMYLL